MTFRIHFPIKRNSLMENKMCFAMLVSDNYVIYYLPKYLELQNLVIVLQHDTLHHLNYNLVDKENNMRVKMRDKQLPDTSLNGLYEIFLMF